MTDDCWVGQGVGQEDLTEEEREHPFVDEEPSDRPAELPAGMAAENRLPPSMTEEEMDLVFTQEQQSSAMQNLIIGSLLMFTLPATVMYASYKLVFEGHFHMKQEDASLYSGIVGIACVFLIVILFVLQAYREEQGIEKRFEALKKRE
ncbi:Vacuolar ATPase assembly integral membrane protein VMA21-like protein [Aphelenchoides fujianensis]|nr:Vacuolar ATPase assembly integral membrane protein VMA21-like protein [Aphelenchoides fujianensis]